MGGTRGLYTLFAPVIYARTLTGSGFLAVDVRLDRVTVRFRIPQHLEVTERSSWYDFLSVAALRASVPQWWTYAVGGELNRPSDAQCRLTYARAWCSMSWVRLEKEIFCLISGPRLRLSCGALRPGGRFRLFGAR